MKINNLKFLHTTEFFSKTWYAASATNIRHVQETATTLCWLWGIPSMRQIIISMDNMQRPLDHPPSHPCISWHLGAEGDVLSLNWSNLTEQYSGLAFFPLALETVCCFDDGIPKPSLPFQSPSHHLHCQHSLPRHGRWAGKQGNNYLLKFPVSVSGRAKRRREWDMGIFGGKARTPPTTLRHTAVA